MAVITIHFPLSQDDVAKLRAGDSVLLNGPLLSGRDAAHKRLITCLKDGRPLPVDLRGETIYYVGPCPTPPGRVIGSAGPTTSGRMDRYTPDLLGQGLRGMIGKGQRSQVVMDAMKQYSAVYFAALGGAGALIARSIRGAKVIAYPDLGPEAIYRLEVVDFPVIVAIDAMGNDLYQFGREEFAKKIPIIDFKGDAV
ncbi:MAG TPA: Fe-S-containing hydro-lyase [Firmicutes bacterium]|jgi:fumarate hydratase subunit beta|nr:Fe-S-containing hydro-lyase [Bacillota bacterium]